MQRKSEILKQQHSCALLIRCYFFLTSVVNENAICFLAMPHYNIENKWHKNILNTFFINTATLRRKLQHSLIVKNYS